MAVLMHSGTSAVGASSLDQARHLVRGSGARVTLARVRVLAQLLQAGCALSHLDLLRGVESVATAPGATHDPVTLDRVTVYRVLDWLVEAGLAHRVAGPDRVFRFSASAAGATAHGHFRCTRCERMYCLREGAGLSRWVSQVLPGGFSGDQIELTVSGCCAQCAAGCSNNQEFSA